MEILTYFFVSKYSSFLMVYPIEAKNGRHFFQWSSPLMGDASMAGCLEQFSEEIWEIWEKVN